MTESYVKKQCLRGQRLPLPNAIRRDVIRLRTKRLYGCRACLLQAIGKTIGCIHAEERWCRCRPRNPITGEPPICGTCHRETHDERALRP